MVLAKGSPNNVWAHFLTEGLGINWYFLYISPNAALCLFRLKNVSLPSNITISQTKVYATVLLVKYFRAESYTEQHSSTVVSVGTLLKNSEIINNINHWSMRVLLMKGNKSKGNKSSAAVSHEYVSHPLQQLKIT